MTCDLQSLNWELADLKPPVPRDRLIFEEVLVKGRGQLEVAREHGISQPRVSKILAEVGAWLCRVLPESVAKEQWEGQVALGFWLAQARLEFLYHKALAAFDASGQDKVVVKQGKRGDVAWEHKTTTMQSPKAGLFNGALRAVVTATRLCTAAAKSSGNVRRESAGMSPANPVMSESAKTDELPPIASSQVQAEPAVADGDLNTLKAREAMIKSIIKIAKRDPKRADWTEAELRHAAEITLAKLDAANLEEEARRRHRAEAQAAKAAARAARDSSVQAAPPIPAAAESIGETAEPCPSQRQHEQASISLDAARLEKLRREREKRKPPEQRRREFLAPLAAG